MRFNFPSFSLKIGPLFTTKHDRRRLADKFMDLGNIGTGILVFSQFVESEKTNFFAFFLGFILLIITYIFAIILVERSL
jgi:hypothetical protein